MKLKENGKAAGKDISPTGDENTLAGGNNGVIERPVVIGAIDQGAHIGGQTMAPAIGIF